MSDTPHDKKKEARERARAKNKNDPNRKQKTKLLKKKWLFATLHLSFLVLELKQPQLAVADERPQQVPQLRWGHLGRLLGVIVPAAPLFVLIAFLGLQAVGGGHVLLVILDARGIPWSTTLGGGGGGQLVNTHHHSKRDGWETRQKIQRWMGRNPHTAHPTPNLSVCASPFLYPTPLLSPLHFSPTLLPDRLPVVYATSLSGKIWAKV